MGGGVRDGIKGPTLLYDLSFQTLKNAEMFSAQVTGPKFEGGGISGGTAKRQSLSYFFKAFPKIISR